MQGKHKEYNDLNALLIDLKKDVQIFLKHEKDKCFFGEFAKANKTTNDCISWWIYFVNMLCSLPYPDDHRQKLILSLKKYYEGNIAQLRMIDEFEFEYKAENAILWYTRDTFLFRILNSALRQNNIPAIFLFGFFIQDLYRKLREEHRKFKLRCLDAKIEILKVYRGQLMHKTEIEKLFKQNQLCGDQIVNNSFLSTTCDRSVAMMFLNSAAQLEDEIQSVLFEIEIDINKRATHPYSDISSISQFNCESEVLFMINMEFRLEEGIAVSYDGNEKVWIVKLSPADDEGMTEELAYFEDMSSRRRLLKQSVGILIGPLNESDLSQVSSGLNDASLNEIDAVFDSLSSLFPQEKSLILGHRFHSVGKYYEDPRQSNYLLAMASYDEALKNWLKYINDDELNCYIDIVQIHIAMGRCYKNHVKDNDMTRQHFDLAIAYSQLAFANVNMTDYEKVKMFDQLYNLCKDMELSGESEKLMYIEMAIEFENSCLVHLQNCYSLSDLRIPNALCEIAGCYRALYKYDEAVENYEKALEIHLQHHSNHYSYYVSQIYGFIIDVYFDYTCDYNSALKYQLIKLEYEQKSVVNTHLSHGSTVDGWIKLKNTYAADSYVKLVDIYIKLQQYDAAYENLQMVRHLYIQKNVTLSQRTMPILIESMKILREYFLETQSNHHLMTRYKNAVTFFLYLIIILMCCELLARLVFKMTGL